MQIEFLSTQTNINAFPHPIPAAKAVPEWYKRMHRSLNPMTLQPEKELAWIDPHSKKFQMGHTMKECIPVRDYLTAGYIIPLWSDFIATVENGLPSFVWPYEDTLKIEWHPLNQIVGTPLEGLRTTAAGTGKFISPWRFKTPPGYSCFFFSPRYSKSVIEVLPAIVDTDMHHEINFPFIYHGEDNKTETILRGEPIIQVVPFKREAWTSKMVVTAEDPRELETKGFRSHIHAAYLRFRHSKKSYR